MRLYTLTTSTGPNGHLDSDKVVNVPDPFARHLIEIGAARPAQEEEAINAKWPHGTEVPKPAKPEGK